MQPDPVQDRLLQRCASWRTDRQYPETSPKSEQRSSDCAPGVEAIPRQAVTAPAALVASPAADYIQVGSSCVRTKFGAGPLWFTYTAKSQNVPAAKLYFICNPSAGMVWYSRV